MGVCRILSRLVSAERSSRSGHHILDINLCKTLISKAMGLGFRVVKK